MAPVSSRLLAALLALAPFAPDARVVLEALDGSTEQRDLAGFSVGPGELEAVLVRFTGLPAPAPVASSGVADVRLANGDRLRARVASGAGERLRLELVGGAGLELPIEELASVVFADALPRSRTAPLEAPREGDRLYRRIGNALDRIDGAIAGFGTDGVRFDSVLGTQSYAWSEVAALFVEALAPPDAAPAGEQRVVVDLVDGGRVRGALRRLDAAGCRLAVGGAVLLLPANALAELLVDDGRVSVLSELPLASAEGGSPFGDDLGLSWPHRLDRAVDGAPLRVGGRTYTRGIGVHAPSRLTWQLDGQPAELRGRAALDDQVQRLAAKGSVIFRVRVDGELSWESGVRRGGDPAVELPRIDLTGAKELELEVDMATDLHMGDRADWLRLLLVRSPR
jgi:hypothetical protein